MWQILPYRRRKKAGYREMPAFLSDPRGLA